MEGLLGEVIRWREAAIADGWEAEPLYGDHEPIGKAAKLTREGYVAQVYARDENNAMVSVWGPDGLAVDPPIPYEWDAIVYMTKVCAYCGRVGDTVRLGFAGRACPACRKELAPKVEYPGWCS